MGYIKCCHFELMSDKSIFLVLNYPYCLLFYIFLQSNIFISKIVAIIWGSMLVLLLLENPNNLAHLFLLSNWSFWSWLQPPSMLVHLYFSSHVKACSFYQGTSFSLGLEGLCCCCFSILYYSLLQPKWVC